jgi:hypothetical protein
MAASFLRQRSTLASLLCAGLVTAGVAVAQTTPKLTAARLVRLAFADASARGAVHEFESEHGGAIGGSGSDDVSLRSGRQIITNTEGVHAKVLVAGPVAYISGNQKALVSYFGFPRAVAQRIGDSWVRIPSSNSYYATVADNATLPSALRQIRPSGHLTEVGVGKMAGQSVIGVRGSLPSGFKGRGTETVYFTDSTHPLPLAGAFVGTGQKFTFTFSKWGENVAVSPPANAIPIGQLGS